MGREGLVRTGGRDDLSAGNQRFCGRAQEEDGLAAVSVPRRRDLAALIVASLVDPDATALMYNTPQFTGKVQGSRPAIVCPRRTCPNKLQRGLGAIVLLGLPALKMPHSSAFGLCRQCAGGLGSAAMVSTP